MCLRLAGRAEWFVDKVDPTSSSYRKALIVNFVHEKRIQIVNSK